jgi:threonyl-tRNA synthetase
MQLRRYISSSSSYIKNRLRVWDELAQLNARSLEKHHQIGKEIRISMQDGRVIPGIAGVTSVFDAVAQAFSAQFAQKFITVYVNGKLYDYGLPVYEDCEINLVDFDSAEGKHVFWHSSAHILGMVLEEQFASKLVYGPPVQEGGFFYDVYNHEK